MMMKTIEKYKNLFRLNLIVVATTFLLLPLADTLRADDGDPFFTIHATYTVGPEPKGPPAPMGGPTDPILNPPSMPDLPPPPPALSPEATYNLELNIEKQRQILQVQFDNNQANTAEYYSGLANLTQLQSAVMAQNLESRYGESKLAGVYAAARAYPAMNPVAMSPRFIAYQIRENQKCLATFEDRYASSATRPSAMQVRAAAVGGAFNEAANIAYKSGDFTPASESAEFAKMALDIALDLTPVVGNIKGLIEGISGYSLVHGRKLSGWERALALASAIPYGSLLKGTRSALPKLLAVFAKDGAAIEKAAVKVIEGTGVKVVEKSFEALKGDGKLGEQVAKLIESKVDDSAALFRKMDPKSVDELTTVFRDGASYERIMNTSKEVREILGDEKLYKYFKEADPAIALKTMHDLAEAERVGKGISALKGAEIEVAESYLKNATEVNSRLLTKESSELLVRVDSPEFLDAVSKGLPLDPKLTRSLPYASEKTAEWYLRAAQPRWVEAGAEGSANLVKSVANGLKAHEVEVVIAGKIEKAALSPNLVRTIPGAEAGKAVVTLSDEAMTAFKYRGIEGAGIKFVGSGGEITKLGSMGEQFAAKLPEIQVIDGGKFVNAFETVRHLDAEGKVVYESLSAIQGVQEPGRILVQAQRAGQNLPGQFFSEIRPLTPEHAEELFKIAKYGNEAGQLKIFVVTEKVAGYAGRVNPQNVIEGAKEIEKLSSGYQFFIPQLKGEDLYKVMKEIRFGVPR